MSLQNHNIGYFLDFSQAFLYSPTCASLLVDHFVKNNLLNYPINLGVAGGKPKSLPAVEKAGEEVKKRTTLFRSVSDLD